MPPPAAPLREARHAPAAIYTSPEIYALEKSKIFMRDWLCIARSEEIAKPGDYLTFMVMDEPIIITRDIGGSINAFRNACAHRGLVVAKGNGNAEGFSCEYHGWRYDLTGRLVVHPSWTKSRVSISRIADCRRWAAMSGRVGSSCRSQTTRRR